MLGDHGIDATGLRDALAAALTASAEEVERLKAFRCEHHAIEPNATIALHQEGSCDVCCAEYQRGFMEGYAQIETEETDKLKAALATARTALEHVLSIADEPMSDADLEGKLMSDTNEIGTICKNALVALPPEGA